MKNCTALILVLLIACCAHAQLNVYSALTIPDSLKKDADLVIREEVIKLSVKDKNTAWYDVHKVFTVLNESAKSALSFVQYSDKFHVLDDAEIRIYDLLGNRKNTWSKKEMNAGKYGDELVPEGKYTFFDVNAASYPVTVEFNYSIKYKGILGLPSYTIQAARESVQQSVFEVEVPSELGVRYKLLNTDKKPLITNNGNKDIYHWESKGQPAFNVEKHSGQSDNFLPL
ncbi:MAG: DUF3857 domain-containing protein, partial [Ferruginibacter sp.]